jgi:hypothetical protein
MASIFTSNSSPVDNKYIFDNVDVTDRSAKIPPIYYAKDSTGCVQTTTHTALNYHQTISAVASRDTQIDVNQWGNN